MFLKVTRAKDRFYLQLVKSYREDGKVRHQVLANLGSHASLEDNPLILSLGRRLLDIAGEKKPESRPFDMEELSRHCYGDVVYRKIWDQLAMGQMLKGILRGRKFRFDFENALFLMVIDRLLCPRSKLATFLNQDRYLNIDEVRLDHEYRLLDVLADSQHKIESFLFNRQKNLFNAEIDVVFYDITTFHFESVRNDELRDFGFSKAGKFNEVQVLLGLLIDAQGKPLGFELHPGNTFEGGTLVGALDKLRDRFAIKKVVIVADKGLNNAANLGLVRQAGYEYIVASPVRRKGARLHKRIHDQEGYQSTASQDAELVFRYKWLDHEVKYKNEQGETVKFEDRLLVTWSAKRAARDRAGRERQLDKARKMVAEKSSLNSKKGAARYLKTQGDRKIIDIDRDKIAEDELWDGYHAIQTNAPLSHEQVMENYAMLWKIEDSFRVMKSTMNTRPVFHWTPQRIRGHFTLCFLAFLIERNLEMRLRDNQIELSPDKIKEVLNSLELSRVRINDEEFFLKAKPRQPAATILRALRIKAPENLTPVSEFNMT